MTKEIKTKPTWVVCYRHFCMDGGLFDYGPIKIEEFFNDFKKADKCAKKVFKRIKNNGQPYVWVFRCEKTYQNGGVAVSE